VLGDALNAVIFSASSNAHMIGAFLLVSGRGNVGSASQLDPAHSDAVQISFAVG